MNLYDVFSGFEAGAIWGGKALSTKVDISFTTCRRYGAASVSELSYGTCKAFVAVRDDSLFKPTRNKTRPHVRKLHVQAQLKKDPQAGG